MILLHLDAGSLEIGGENIGVADLLARIHVPVVHAGVADQGLEQFDGFVTTQLGHDASLADARVARGASARHQRKQVAAAAGSLLIAKPSQRGR